MGGRDSVVGTGDPLMRGPGRRMPRVQCTGHGETLGKGPGAPTRHVGIEGELPGRALPSVSGAGRLGDSVVPGGAVVGDSDVVKVHTPRYPLCCWK